MSASVPPPNHWVRRVVVGWAIFLGGFGAYGWLIDPRAGASAAAIALVSLFACAMMLNTSYQLRLAKGKKTSVRIWICALFLFASWSGYSAHHAVTVVFGDLGAIEGAYIMAFFSATSLIDPWLMWAVADTELGSATVRPQVADYPPVQAEPVEHSAKVVEFPASGARGSATLAAAVAGVAGLSAGGGGLAADLQPPAIHEPPGRVMDASPQAHAERLLRNGVSQRMAAERTKLTRYQIGQIARAIKEEAAA